MVDTFRYAGFGAETTFHTPVSAAFHIDADSLGLDAPDNPEIVIPTGMGRGDRDTVPGFYASQGPIEYAPDIESIGWFLRWFLGGYSYTAGASLDLPNLHEIYGTNSHTLKSFTVREGKDAFEQVFAGGVMNSIDLNVDVGTTIAKCNLGIIAGRDTEATLQDYASLTLRDANTKPLGTAQATAYINSVDESTKFKSLRVAMTNGIDARSAQRFGSMFPQAGFIPTKRNIVFTCSLVFEDLTHKRLFWGAESGASTTGSIKVPMSLRLTDPDGSRYLNICLPRAHLQSVKLPGRGTDTLVQDIVGRALISPTVLLNDSSVVSTDCLVSLENYTGTMA
jgi:hypothetical protein